MAMAFRVKLAIDVCLCRLSKLVSGRRKGKQVAGESFRRLVSLCFSERLVSSLSTCLQSLCQLVFMATRRLSSCSFEGQYAPRSLDPPPPPPPAPPPPNDGNTGPHNSESTQYKDRSNTENTDLRNCGEEGRLCRPRSHVSTQRGDVSPEQPSWSLGSLLLRFNALTPGLLR